MGETVDAVVLVSGGLDSCVTCACALREAGRVAALHAGYGQRTAEREQKSFEAIADRYRIPSALRRRLDMSFLGAFGGSALTDDSIPVPEGLESRGIPATYVPFRNGVLLAAAVSWAETLDASSVWIGAVEEDGSGYPDCRDSFLTAFEAAARIGTRTGAKMRIVRPLVGLRKSEIVRRGIDLGAPIELTWSCYRSSDRACGRCESCLLRLRGFAEAGASDPIPYGGQEDGVA